MQFVGFLHYSPQDFFMLEPVEIIDLLEQAKMRFRYDHELQYIAVLNAIGPIFSKKYKYQNVFENENKKTTVTDDERKEMIDFLKDW